MTLGQRNNCTTRTATKTSALPHVRYHPSIQTPLDHNADHPADRSANHPADRSANHPANRSANHPANHPANHSARIHSRYIIPQVRYHPSLKTSAGPTSPQGMDQSKRTDEAKDRDCTTARSAPKGGASEEQGSSGGATQNGRQKPARTRSKKENGKTSLRNFDGTSKGTSKNDAAAEGGGDCEIKDEPLNGVKGDGANVVPQTQPRKQTRKNVKKQTPVSVRLSDGASCRPGCEIEPKDPVQNQTPTSPRSDGGDTDAATGDSPRKGARKKYQNSQKSNQNSGNDQEPPSPSPGPAAEPVRPTVPSSDLDEVEPRPGSSLHPDFVAEVEVRTRGQRNNPEWFRLRKNRITASVAHSIAHCKFVNGKSTTPPESYIRTILGDSRRVQTRAMSWGIDHEREAVLRYQEKQSAALARPLHVQDCGLFIDGARPWLAGSPDGIVMDADTGQWLRCLEVKCPHKHRARSVEAAARSDPTFCLELSHQEGAPQLSLKRTHPYFTQVQCQLAVTGLKMADFVVFTERDLAVVQVRFDPDFWDQTVSKLELFYTKAVVPALREKSPAWNREM